MPIENIVVEWNVRPHREYLPDYIRLIEDELGNKPNASTIEDIPLEDLSYSKGVEKLRYLEHLGVLDFLRSKSHFGSSVNALANYLSLITGEKSHQKNLNYVYNSKNDPDDNPFKEKAMEKAKQYLVDKNLLHWFTVS